MKPDDCIYYDGDEKGNEFIVHPNAPSPAQSIAYLLGYSSLESMLRGAANRDKPFERLFQEHPKEVHQ